MVATFPESTTDQNQVGVPPLGGRYSRRPPKGGTPTTSIVGCQALGTSKREGKTMRTIHGTSEEIRAGRLSAVQLLEECLARIERLEPTVRAWVLVDRERALGEARQRDEEL